MTNETGGGRWLVEPPAPHEVRFQIAAGDQVEVTPEIQEAFTHLVQTLRGDDMQGYVYDPKCTTKSIYCHDNGKCSAEHQYPNCFIDYRCQIAQPG